MIAHARYTTVYARYAQVQVWVLFQRCLYLIVLKINRLDRFLLCRSSALLQVPGNIREEDDATKHETSADPVSHGEGVLEIPNGKQEGEKLPEGENERRGETCALGGEDKDSRNADVLEDDIACEVDDHDGHVYIKEWQRSKFTGYADLPVVVDIWGQEQEPREGQGVGVEKSLFCMLAKLAKYDLLVYTHSS